MCVGFSCVLTWLVPCCWMLNLLVGSLRNGLTPADLLFPWFIFIMGTSMTVSLQNVKDHTQSARGLIVFKVVKRAVLLFCIGLFLNNGNDLPTWRIPGVVHLPVPLSNVFLSTGSAVLLLRLPCPSCSTHPTPLLHSLDRCAHS